VGTDASLANSGGTVAVLSPDGTILAFIARKGTGGGNQLYVRRLNQLQAVALSGTDDAAGPFFSPDGRWIAFFAGGKLKKISVTGGAAVTLCDAPDNRGADWAEDGGIVLSPNSVLGVRLLRVSASGGPPVPLTALADGEVTQRWPQMLPGGNAVLFTSSRTTGAFDDADLVVQTLPTGVRKVVQRGAYHGRYVSSGHLVYVHGGTLFAAPFDLGRLEMTATPVPALEALMSNTDTGGAQFDVATNGTLVYLPGQNASHGLPINWVDRKGNTTALRTTPAAWSNLHFSPDGSRLAFQILDGQSDIWVYEWSRETVTRLTFDPGLDMKPVWTPDGRRIVFTSQRADKSTPNLYWQRIDGTGEAQRLTDSRNLQLPGSWHPSGKFLAFEEQFPHTSTDLMILAMEGDEASGWRPGTPAVFLTSPFTEREPMFSPDGRWLAYSSNESGRNEIYVRPFPGPGGKWQISMGGGLFPTWSRAKHELYFDDNGQIMIATYAVEGDSLRVEKPRPWSEGRYLTSVGSRMFDLHPDGERVALASLQTTANARQAHITFLFNFFDELRRLAPAGQRR
jgi:serine/threonine-protein kinase